MASKFLSLKNSKFFSGLKILRPECLPLLLLCCVALNSKNVMRNITGEFRHQTDQRSDDSNLQHVKGETGRDRYKAVS